MNCIQCGGALASGEVFCGSCGAKNLQAPPAIPEVVRSRGNRLLGGGIVLTVLSTLFIWSATFELTILAGSITTVAALYLLIAGVGVREGAVWAIRHLPAEVRERPEVVAYFWSDEVCPGCGVAPAEASAFCMGCGHGLNPPPTPYLQGAALAFRRLLKPQPVEPPRTASFRKREAHETTDKLLVAAIAIIALGWIASNEFSSFRRYIIVVSVTVPAFLMLFWLRQQDRYEPEPLNLMLIAVGWGMLSGVFVIPLNSFFGFAPIAGVTEEIAKGAIVLLFATHRVWRKEMNGPTDGLIYGAAAGLGFAAMENFSYVIRIGGEDPLYLLEGLIIRSGGLLGHMIYTGLTGSFIGLMLLRNGRATPRDLLVGFLPGGAIHALNNFAGFFGAVGLIVPMIACGIGAWWFFKILAESLRDEAAWGYLAGRAPVEPEEAPALAP